MSTKSNLYHELQSVGATDDELDALVGIATRIQSLPVEAFSDVTEDIAPKRHFNFGFGFTFAGLAAACFVLVGMTLVTFSQTSVTGSPLYAIKKVSEATAVLVHPEYRAVVMMHRAEEVKTLVATKAPSSKVLATLDDYNVQARTYKMPTYETLEYCKTNLQLAAAMAPPAERQAIDQTLASLST